jgi:excisionase family DNA binding protein
MAVNTAGQTYELSVTGYGRLCLSVTETANAVGVSKPLVWQAIARGDLTVARAGRRVLVPVAAIHNWIRSMTGTNQGVLL